MALEAPPKDSDEEDNDDLPHRNGRETSGDPKQDASNMARDEVDEEEEEEEEPKLKYAPLTKNLSSLYRNGDATSSFLVGGDKMVCNQPLIGIVRLKIYRSLEHTMAIS
jgi:vacuolar protein sorting-associated protein 41